MDVLRRFPLLAALGATALLAACGGSEPPAPAGSEANPIKAETSEAVADRSNEAAVAAGSAEQPGYQELVERQVENPRTRFTPCNLVTRAQAASILGAAVQEPLEAKQGPTCLYRTKDGDDFVSVAVQSARFRELRSMLSQSLRVDAGGRTAYCGHAGQDMLYVRLSARRVLSIAGSCDVATKFAAKAVREL